MRRPARNASIVVLALSLAALPEVAGCTKSVKQESTAEKPVESAGTTTPSTAPAATPVERGAVSRRADSSPSDARPAGQRVKRAVMIIAPANFRDEELTEPKAILVKSGFRVDVASSAKGPVIGMLGGVAQPDLPVDRVKVDDYDIVVFVGGSGAKSYFNSPVAHRIAKQAAAKGKVLGAICLAPAILAKAGVLNGKQATVYPAAEAVLKSGGAQLQKKAVVVDGRLVTANGPKAATLFGNALLNAAARAPAAPRAARKRPHP